MRAEIFADATDVHIRTEEDTSVTKARSLYPRNLSLPIPKDLLKPLSEDEGWAWKLLEMVADAKILDFVKYDLLAEASKVGFEAVASKLEMYNRDAPNGVPKIYSSINDPDELDLTDGILCVEIIVRGLESGALDFPPNVYAIPVEIISVTKREFDFIRNDLTKFFSFLKSVLSVPRETVSWQRRLDCIQEYFVDKGEAFRILEGMMRDCSRKIKREELCNRINCDKIVRTRDGYMLSVGPDAYYLVLENGRVFKIRGHGTTLKRNVLKVYNGEKLDYKLLVEEVDEERLAEISHAIGEIRPDLAVVI
jgi:hypothetical protein